MKLTVVGSGYVGLVAAVCFAELGFEVCCVDCDAEKIAALRQAHCIIHEQHLPELLQRHVRHGLHFSTSLAEAAAHSDVIFIAVGTPPLPSGSLDLSQVEAVARELGPQLTSGYRLIICKSTVPAGSTRWIQRILLLNGANPECFDVAFNPEFLREGTAVTDFLYPDRIVVGADSARAQLRLAELYRPLYSGDYLCRAGRIACSVHATPEFHATSIVSAEIIKSASNAFLAMKISFINSVANLCEHTGADIEEVKRGVGSDRRIGNRFLNAGIGYGGSCFPKDVRAFEEMAESYGMHFNLLANVTQVNLDQRQRFIQKVRQALWTLNGKRLAVLGLAYKGGTDDIRESPAIGILKDLLIEGCSIRAYDPAATERSRPLFLGQNIEFCTDAYSAIEGADALLILTDWKEFATLHLDGVRQLLRYPIVVDGRNLFSPRQMAAAGLHYHSIGRSILAPESIAAAQHDAQAWERSTLVAGN